VINKNLLNQMQKKLAKIQEDLANEEVTGTAGGGVVTVVANGQQELRSVKISPEAIDPEDVEMLEDLVLAAANEALGKSRELAAQRMGSLTGGMKIPGF
jgi:nucleoid-associated protein EbfC